jgi:predicted DNA-binding transcriptional regulator YafY
MLDVQLKFKRQVELLGLTLKNTDAMADTDFGILFDCEVPTIKRDMKEIRNLGIPIHSRKRLGLFVAGASNLPMDTFGKLIIQYMSLSVGDGRLDKGTKLLLKQHRDQAVALLVLLQRSVESCTEVVISYRREDGGLDEGRVLQPLLVFNNEGHWRVLARNDDRIKQYLLAKIVTFGPGRKKFKRIPKQEIDDMFRYSFRSWIGPDKYTVKLHIANEWARRIRNSLVLESQALTEHEDGSITMDGVVNSLEEFASWVVSRGKGVRVLEPDALATKVMDIARGTLENYDNHR